MTTQQELLLHLQGLEEKLHDPANRASTELVRDLLADSFFEFGSSGNVYDSGKEEIILRLSVEAPVTMTPLVEAMDYTLNLLAPGVALLTYRSVRRSDANEKAAHVLRSSIWQQQSDGRWQMAFHQGTPAAEK